MPKRILGLDLGSHTIKVAEFQQSWNGLELSQLCLTQRPEGDELSYALRDMIQSYQLGTESVVCAIPAAQTTSRHLSFPFRDRRKLKQAVPFELEEHLPFELDEFLVDWELIPTEEDETKVLATVTRQGNVADLLAELKDADIDPTILDAEGLALGNLPQLFDLPGTRFLVDIGHSKTCMCLTIDGQPIASRTIPIAGLAITKVLAQERGIDLETAERIKHEGIFENDFESNSPGSLEVLDRIAREIARTLDSIEPLLGGTAAERVDGISIFGGTANIHRLDDYLAGRTGLPTERLAFPPPSEDGPQLIANGDPVIFGAALALGLRGTGKAKTRMNFRQGEFAPRFDFGNLGREFLPTAILAGVVLLLVLTFAITTISLRSNRADDLEDLMRKQYSQLFPDQSAPKDVQKSLRTAVDKAHDEADFLGIYRGDLSALDLLAEVSVAIPEGGVIVYREVRVNRNIITIRGHSRSFEAVDQLKAKLREFEAFTRVEVSEVSSDREGKVFSMTISLAETEESS